MNFSQLTEQFSASLPGTDAYVKVKETLRSLMKSDPQHAAAYFIIFGFARSYVILHDDEGLSIEFAESAKQQLLGYMHKVETALTQDTATLLQAMNEVVLDYEGKRDFF